MSRPKTSLDGEKLLAKNARGIGGDLLAFCPSSFAVGLNSLVGGTRVTWEEVCQDQKQSVRTKREAGLIRGR